MEFFRKRSIAWLITIIVIIASTIIGAGSSLNKLREEAISIFYLGEEKDGAGIQHDLEMIMSDSYNLTVVARRYMNEDDKLISAVRKNREALSLAKTPGEKYRQAQNLLSSVTELYVHLGDMQLSEKDSNFRNSLYANINSHNIIISRSTYNQHAREFNNILKSFPANILSFFAFVSELELYE
jgi:hypothetical protein